MLLDIAIYIYIAGIVATSVYHLWQFSQGIKILRSGSSSIFMGLEVIKEIVKSVLWPVTSIIFILQLPFANGTLNDFNDVLNDYNGYVDEDERGGLMLFYLTILGAAFNLFCLASLDDATGKGIFYIAATVCAVGAGIIYTVEDRYGN